MQINRSEISTGILVLVTMAILGGVLVVIGMPGVLTPMNTFYVSFDNAAGLRPGDPVLLAGRQIGEVTGLVSPVPVADRPDSHPDYEVLIEVKVERDACVRSLITTRLYQQGLMGQMVIDFIQGTETSPVAPDNSTFVGERVPQISELVATNIERLTGGTSDIAISMQNVRQLTETVKRETSGTSDLAVSMDNLRQFTETVNREPWRLLRKP